MTKRYAYNLDRMSLFEMKQVPTSYAGASATINNFGKKTGTLFIIEKYDNKIIIKRVR